MYELERVLRVCGGFSCSMSTTCDGAVQAVYRTMREGDTVMDYT